MRLRIDAIAAFGDGYESEKGEYTQRHRRWAGRLVGGDCLVTLRGLESPEPYTASHETTTHQLERGNLTGVLLHSKTFSIHLFSVPKLAIINTNTTTSY